MQGGLECVLTQKCALEMSVATLYKSFSMQQKRTLSLDLANGIVNNYFCLLVMRTKTKWQDMWLWFCNCSCPKNLSPQQIRNQNIISPILAMWWWFGKNKIELSDLSCRWIRRERGEERRSKPVRRWRIVSPDPQIHEESLGAWFIWPRFIAL